MVDVWNRLSGEVVEPDTIAAFKRYLDRYMDRIDVERHGKYNHLRCTLGRLGGVGPKGV